MRLLLTLLLFAMFGLCLTSLGCAGSEDEPDGDTITAVIAAGVALGPGGVITVAPSSNITLELILDPNQTPSAFRWTATNGGVLGSPNTKNNTLAVGDTERTIAVRVEVDISPVSGSGVETFRFDFQVIVATNLTRLIKSISVDGIAHQNNAAFDINGARTVSLKVVLLSGITATTVTGVATRGFVQPFTGITTPPAISVWQMPNTPGIDVLTFTVGGTNGSVSGTEVWNLTANVK